GTAFRDARFLPPHTTERLARQWSAREVQTREHRGRPYSHRDGSFGNRRPHNSEPRYALSPTATGEVHSRQGMVQDGLLRAKCTLLVGRLSSPRSRSSARTDWASGSCILQTGLLGLRWTQRATAIDQPMIAVWQLESRLGDRSRRHKYRPFLT